MLLLRHSLHLNGVSVFLLLCLQKAQNKKSGNPQSVYSSLLQFNISSGARPDFAGVQFLSGLHPQWDSRRIVMNFRLYSTITEPHKNKRPTPSAVLANESVRHLYSRTDIKNNNKRAKEHYDSFIFSFLI